MLMTTDRSILGHGPVLSVSDETTAFLIKRVKNQPIRYIGKIENS